MDSTTFPIPDKLVPSNDKTALEKTGPKTFGPKAVCVPPHLLNPDGTLVPWVTSQYLGPDALTEEKLTEPLEYDKEQTAAGRGWQSRDPTSRDIHQHHETLSPERARLSREQLKGLKDAESISQRLEECGIAEPEPEAPDFYAAWNLQDNNPSGRQTLQPEWGPATFEIPTGHELADWDGTMMRPPVEWEDRGSSINGDWQNQLWEWLEREETSGVELIDLTTQSYITGMGTVDGTTQLISPFIHPPTTPNPERRTRHGQTSNNVGQYHADLLRGQGFPYNQGQHGGFKWGHGPSANNRQRPNPHVPRANIYLRFATTADLAACKNIYDSYGDHSIIGPKEGSLAEDGLLNAYVDVCKSKLPWLVAVDRNSTRVRQRGPATEEKVLGFAYAAEYGDRDDPYRHTAEIKFFTHRQHLRQGIAKSLVDKTVAFLDPMYSERGACLFLSGGGWWTPGGQRPISRVICQLRHKSRRSMEVEWIKPWLSQWNFKETSTAVNAGSKGEQSVDIVLLEMITGSSFDV